MAEAGRCEALDLQNNIGAQQPDQMPTVWAQRGRARRIIPGVNDFATLHPELAAQWDQERNEGLNPNQLLPGSNKKVWWKCEKGHFWQAIVNTRILKKSGCPYCSGRLAIPGENDIATCCPEVVPLWDEERNGDLTPGQILPYSAKKVWWKCDKGHSWQAAIFSVAANGNRCPYCSRRKLAPGETDLVARYPEVVKLWDSERNEVSPSEVFAGSARKYWWKCEKGHSWQAATYALTVNGSRCPYCVGKKAIPGETDLATRYPEVIALWDSERNEVSPDEVLPYSKKKYWWRCKEGHHWEAIVASVAIKKSGCPYCSGHRKIPGKTDLATLYPKVADLWAYDRNEIEISSVAPTSRKYVWWHCEKGHYWHAQIYSVASGKSHCPECAKAARMLRRSMLKEGISEEPPTHDPDIGCVI